MGRLPVFSAEPPQYHQEGLPVAETTGWYEKVGELTLYLDPWRGEIRQWGWQILATMQRAEEAGIEVADLPADRKRIFYKPNDFNMNNPSFKTTNNWWTQLDHSLYHWPDVLSFTFAQGNGFQSPGHSSFSRSEALARFADTFGISHYSALPDISIRLYTISRTRLEIHHCLHYHARGIRVEEKGGLGQGLGWALQAGGSSQPDHERSS